MALYRFKQFVLATLLASFLLLVPCSPTLAAPKSSIAEIKKKAMELVDKTATYAGLGDQKKVTVEQIIGSLVQAALLLVGAIFFALMVYGGYIWMTARGNSEQVTKAKDTIINASIGIVVVMAAWVITQYILTSVLTAAKLL